MKRFNCDFGSRFRILKGGKISLVVSAILSSTTLVFASPTGGVVTSGKADISQSGNTTNITQSTNKATINWQDFSIKSNETVNFNQPNVNSITLNRVVGNERSVIDGALNANGQVWILNSNGILFNKDSKINTAGILATTKNITDADFNAGNYKFTGDSTAGVINMGTIEASDSGYVALLANTVQNDGTIKAYRGTVHLTGASEATINLNGNSIVSLTVNKGVLDALVENKGAVLADGGKIFLTTNAVDEILKGVVNNSGLIEANSLDDISGTVELFAHGGTANVSGTIEAVGGFVETSGKELSIESATNIKASHWLIDPENITIESTGGDDVTGVSIAANAIETYLSGTGSLTLQADNNINVNQALSWNSNTLTLTAGNDININALMSASSSAGLALNYGATGAINMGMNADKTAFLGKVNLADSSTLSVNGTAYTIIRDKTALQNINNSLTGKYAIGTDLSSLGDFTPIGGTLSDANAFTGILEGLGHSVTGVNLNVSTTIQNQGLFRMLGNGSSGSISNLDLGIAVGDTTKRGVGSLVGYNWGTIANVHVSGSIISSSIDGAGTIIGGVVGSNGSFGIIKNASVSDMTITHTGNTSSVTIGGIVGHNNGTLSSLKTASTTIINTVKGGGYTLGSVGGVVGLASAVFSDVESATTINITGSQDFNNIGGIIGKSSAFGTFQNLTSKAIISSPNGGSANYVGGVIGQSGSGESFFNIKFLAPGSITMSGATSYNTVGGLIGSLSSGSVDGGEVTGSISIPNATGGHSIGGAIGNASGYGEDIKNISVSSNMNFGAINDYIGGVIGFSYQKNITNNTFSGTLTTAGSSYIGGIVGYNLYNSLKNNTFSGAINVTNANAKQVGGISGESTSTAEDTTNNKATSQITINNTEATTDIGVAPTYFGKILGKGFIGLSSVVYNFAPLTDIYTYDGTTKTLSALWTSASILGNDYSSWIAGTDYNFIYNSGVVTDFTNAGNYSSISIDVLKSGYQEASSGNTTGTLTIAKRAVNLTAEKDYDTNANFTTGITLGNIVDGDTVTIESGSASTLSATPDTYTSFASSTLALSNSNYTITGGTVNAIINKLDATYTLSGSSVNNASTINTGVAITLPTASITSVEPVATATVKVYDAQNNDVTDQALVGTLTAGSYTIKTVLSDTIYKIGDASDTITFNVVVPTPVPNPEPTPTPVPNPEPTPTPVPNPEPTKQDPKIEKLITSIVNNTTTNVNLPKDILLPKVNLGQNMPILPITQTVQASPMMQNLGKKLGLNQGEELSLVSTVLEGQATEKITLGELKDLSDDSNNPNERRNTPIETRVALGDNSIVELVNGGVSLPEGVDQEFYVTKNKKNKK